MHSSSGGLAAYLAEVVDASTTSAAAATTEVAAWSLLDYGACLLSGLSKLPSAWPATEPGRCAAAAHAEDRDDIHWDSLTHPGGVVWPAVLAAAKDARADGPSIVRAAAVGYEVMTRLSDVLGPGHRQYWHPTTSCGPAAAAAAAATLLGGRGAVVDAVGHATSVAGGSSQALFERSGTRLFHRAYAVEVGLLAARAAVAGIDGTRFGLEQETGVLAALRADGARSIGVADRLKPAIGAASPRLLSATGWAHAACQAAFTLGPLSPESIESVIVEVAPAGALLAGETHPSTDDEAWWSIPHAVASVLVSGESRSLDGGLSRDNGVRNLADRVKVEGTRLDVSAAVSVQLRAGTSRSATSWPLGHAENPVSDADRVAKWNRLTGSGGEWVHSYFAACLENADPSEQLSEQLQEKRNDSNTGLDSE